MKKFIIAIVAAFMFFVTGIAMAVTLSGDVGIQNKVVYQGVRYDTSVVNPFVDVKVQTVDGLFVSGSMQTTKYDTKVLESFNTVSAGWDGSVSGVGTKVYMDKTFFSNIAGSNSASSVGVKTTTYNLYFDYSYVFNNTVVTKGHDQVYKLGFADKFDKLGVDLSVVGKTYQAQNVSRFNSAQASISYDVLPNVVVFSSVIYGGKAANGGKLPNQGIFGAKYLF